MSVNSASSSVAAVSIAYISSPDDALDLSNTIQSNLTDQMRDSISSQITVAASLVNRLIKMNQILIHLQKFGNGLFKPVTVDSLAATPKTSDALKSLFLNDGPSLGTDDTEASATIADLSGLGIAINAPRQTPVLLEVYDKNGNLVSKFFTWLNDAQRNSIGGSAVKSTTYPGANEQKNKFSDLTVVSYSFDQYSKLTPSQTDVNTAITLISSLAKSLDAEFAATLDDTTKASDKLQKIVDDNADTRKSQSQQISALAAKQQEQLLELLNKFRILKLERDANMRMQAKKIGPEISSLVKNESEKIESVSRIDDDMVGHSLSTTHLNNSDLQLQQILTSLTAGKNVSNSNLQRRQIETDINAGQNFNVSDLQQQVSAVLTAGANINTPENRIPV